MKDFYKKQLDKYGKYKFMFAYSIVFAIILTVIVTFLTPVLYGVPVDQRRIVIYFIAYIGVGFVSSFFEIRKIQGR